MSYIANKLLLDGNIFCLETAIDLMTYYVQNLVLLRERGNKLRDIAEENQFNVKGKVVHTKELPKDTFSLINRIIWNNKNLVTTLWRNELKSLAEKYLVLLGRSRSHSSLFNEKTGISIKTQVLITAELYIRLVATRGDLSEDPTRLQGAVINLLEQLKYCGEIWGHFHINYTVNIEGKSRTEIFCLWAFATLWHSVFDQRLFNAKDEEVKQYITKKADTTKFIRTLYTNQKLSGGLLVIAYSSELEGRKGKKRKALEEPEEEDKKDN